MPLRRLIDILIARRTIALVAFLACLAVAAVASFVLPARYQASTTIVVDLFSADRVAGVQMSPMAINQYMATQLGILRSSRVALDVVRRLDLEKDAKLRAEFAESARGGALADWIAARVAKTLDVRPARESGVIELVVTGRTPEQAATTANAFAEAYIQTTLALRTAPARETNTFFGETSTALGSELERAQAKLSQFQDQSGMGATDERVDSEVARLEQLTAQLTQAQAQTADARTRRDLARGARGADAATLPEVVTNPAVQALRGDLAREESRLANLGERLGPNHPQYQTARDDVAAVRQRLAAEIERTQKNLDTAREREAITDLESRSRQTNVAVLNRAVPPTERAFPRMSLNLALAAVLGALAAIALALAAEFNDRRVYRREDLQAVLGVPVLAELARSGAPMRRAP